MLKPVLVATAAASVMVGAGFTATATAEVEAPVFLTVDVGQAALPGGMVTVTGSVGAGCTTGKYKVLQEYWPEGAQSTSKVVEYTQTGYPTTDPGQLELHADGSFTAKVGVPVDATRTDLYGDLPGTVPHYLWVEVSGCESGAWKRTSDHYGTSVEVQPVSALTELTASPPTVQAGGTLTVVAERCYGAVAKAWAEVGSTEVPSASTTVGQGQTTVTFDIPAGAASDGHATAVVLCTQSQTPDNRNRVDFAVQSALTTGANPVSGGSGSGGSVSGGSGSGTSTSTTGSGSGSSTTGVSSGAATTATTTTATSASRTTTTVAAAATPVAAEATYAG